MREVEKELLGKITNDNISQFKKAYHIAKKKSREFFYFENKKNFNRSRKMCDGIYKSKIKLCEKREIM